VITETSAVAFRQNLGEMLNIVQYRNDSVLIKKDGKPVAALIDARLFERIRRMQERFDALCDRLEQSYAGVPKDVALAEIEQATALARRETADAWRASGRLPALPAAAASPAKRAKRGASAERTKGAKAKPTSKTPR
jgi:prevent-host-death family protein